MNDYFHSSYQREEIRSSEETIHEKCVSVSCHWNKGCRKINSLQATYWSLVWCKLVLSIIRTRDGHIPFYKYEYTHIWHSLMLVKNRKLRTPVMWMSLCWKGLRSKSPVGWFSETKEIAVLSCAWKESIFWHFPISIKWWMTQESFLIICYHSNPCPCINQILSKWWISIPPPHVPISYTQGRRVQLAVTPINNHVTMRWM